MYADKIKTVRGSNVIIHFLTPPFDTAPLQNKVQLLYRVIPSQISYQEQDLSGW